MRLTPTEPDIKTLVGRIESGELNLQPEFQRGEVWNTGKKQRLIDSVLRDWHIPPIHIVIVEESGDQEVLDGQQRLVAIRDFFEGRLTVDGLTEPTDEELVRLDGLRYDQLPEKFRRRFDSFPIRIFRITDYKAGEPGELFFRLNQPANLTAPEQRNAFFGPARHQVKTLVRKFEQYQIDEKVLGFSNSRMAYDDVIARLCYSLERGTLREKVDAPDITAKFRSPSGFPSEAVERVDTAIALLGRLLTEVAPRPRFNKATLFSWLGFLVVIGDMVGNKASSADVQRLSHYISSFELSRGLVKSRQWRTLELRVRFGDLNGDSLLNIFAIFNDRASSRVTDALSVLTRDFLIWLMYYAANTDIKAASFVPTSRLRPLAESYNLLLTNQEIEKVLAQTLQTPSWGSI